jgi:hypothetical protein
MFRVRSLAVAIAVLALSAGAVAAFTTLPDAAWNGLNKANDVSGQTVPARPDDLPTSVDVQVDTTAQDLPDAAAHGADVSTVATFDDATPDTNRGVDVSEVARDNNGAAAREEHKPADAGPPTDAGQPDDPGPPDSVELPDAAPEDPGPPADPGQPEEPGRPN